MSIVAAWTLDERSIGNTKFVDAELTDDQMKLITTEKQHSSMLTAHQGPSILIEMYTIFGEGTF